MTTLRPIARRSTSAQIAEQLRDAIAGGRFAPGDQVTEQGLAEELRVSRGPVREALQRLMQEGLLIGEPNRSVVVMSLSDEDVADLYLARLALEREAALVLAAHAAPEALAPLDALVTKLAAAVRRRRWTETAAIDSAFHAALVEASGSPRLVRMFATVQVETRFCLTVLRSAHPPQANLAAEHESVLAAIRSGHATRIGAVLEEHMAAAVATLVRPAQ